MSRRKQENPSFKAMQARQYRKNQRGQKRFEAPLRKFIEHKYKDIFQEYVDLFIQMDTNHPDKIDLTKTETFKRWKRSNEAVPPAPPTDILSTAIRETIEQDRIETVINEYSEDIDEDNEEESNTDNCGADTSSDNESEASVAENEGGEEVPNAVMEGLAAAQQVDDIVNELIRDEELRALLRPEPAEDEGIELNIFDEIDIEPFDFSMEVEGPDW